MIFNIQRFCVNDGPGIRTTVFIKGCPLHCAWCHNPESQSFSRELSFDASKCTLCRKCAELCPNGCHTFSDGKHIIDREKCALCGKCLEAYCGNLSIIGSGKTSDEIIAAVLRDRSFYEKSGGGMTLSGGEPMADFPFALDLMSKAKENGLHTCMETSGFAPTEKILEIAAFTDIFLYDCKETDSALHKKYTGVSDELILKNLHALNAAGAKIILRCPIIPGYNDRPEHFKAIGSLAESLENIMEINVEPYHPLGTKKSENLGRISETASVEFPSAEKAKEWIDDIQKYTQKLVRKA